MCRFYSTWREVPPSKCLVGKELRQQGECTNRLELRDHVTGPLDGDECEALVVDRISGHVGALLLRGVGKPRVPVFDDGEAHFARPLLGAVEWHAPIHVAAEDDDAV